MIITILYRSLQSARIGWLKLKPIYSQHKWTWFIDSLCFSIQCLLHVSGGLELSNLWTDPMLPEFECPAFLFFRQELPHLGLWCLCKCSGHIVSDISGDSVYDTWSSCNRTMLFLSPRHIIVDHVCIVTSTKVPIETQLQWEALVAVHGFTVFV